MAKTPQWRRAPKGSWTRSTSRVTTTSDTRRNGDEPRRARGLWTQLPSLSRSISPQWRRAPKGSWTYDRVVRNTEKIEPQWRRAPKGSWTVSGTEQGEVNVDAAMETSPEGLVDTSTRWPVRMGCCCRNGDEPRRARGRRSNVSAPNGIFVPQWRRAPKGSWTRAVTSAASPRCSSRNGDEPRRARGRAVLVEPPGQGSRAAMETSPEGLVDQEPSFTLSPPQIGRNGDEPRRARGPPTPSTPS